METSHNNPDTLIMVMMKLSIFFLLCLAILNAPHVKGQTIPGQEPMIKFNNLNKYEMLIRSGTQTALAGANSRALFLAETTAPSI
ncbi:hypothetical protein SAMN05421813_13158 [Daejeonella rubra]|uniref:Uncharacterized protein n=1 Tax=Daejeonella rubra TaxID=990371 RepID=A0A1G9XQK4_9SPHI|nr:hypothetical protein SAMN05421813_13158 [Daejeonella rubra]